MIKKLLVLFLVVFVLGLGITIFRKLYHPIFKPPTVDNPVVVTDLKPKQPKKEDEKLIPKDEILLSEVPIGNFPSALPGKSVDVSVLVSAKCTTCTAAYRRKDRLITMYGFYWEPKFFIGADSGGFIPAGFAATIFRYDRYCLQGIVAFPTVGAGLSIDLTKNFYVLGGLGVRYMETSDLSKLSTYNISMEELTKVRPLVGLGFNF